MKNREPLRFVPLVVAIVALALVAVAILMTARRPEPAPRPPVAPPEAAPLVVDTVLLSAGNREQPGGVACDVIRYAGDASFVAVRGAWSGWTTNHPMERKDGEWRLNVAALDLTFGEYGFKFLPDGEWEAGENRYLMINPDGRVERPADWILAARLTGRRRIDVQVKDLTPEVRASAVRLVPDVPLADVAWTSAPTDRRTLGYTLGRDVVAFCFDESRYGLSVPPDATVSVAGSFNNWNAAHDGWRLSDPDDDGVWEGRFALAAREEAVFKFVIDGTRWVPVPPEWPNAVRDEDGNTNLRLDPRLTGMHTLRIDTAEALALSNLYMVVLDPPGPAWAAAAVNPLERADRLRSAKALGAVLDKAAGATTYRLFAPRAARVDLCLYDAPAAGDGFGSLADEPAGVYPMVLDPAEGIWETVRGVLDTGRPYRFRVAGPKGRGEAFNAAAPLGDPYARAVPHAHNHPLVIDPDAPTPWFAGWTDADYRAPAWEDMLIYETHVRHLTMHPSSGVAPALRGTYAGMAASSLTDTGLAHLKKLGVNMIELLPIAEFANGTDEHQWGYATAYFFAPEASYGREPRKGSQFYEFKALVNHLHREGFGVILDVVYNHIGSPNVFAGIDRKYYFRLTPDAGYSNYSGCGNDVRTEAPMMRRLIVDNVLYWMREFHVDGFRFDLAELIDMETLMAVRDAARALNPDVLLISEPWSFRGDHKRKLRGTGWSAWNNDFRDPVKHFALGSGDRGAVKRALLGSVDTWTDGPLQTVNYLDSHDDMALADELSRHPRRDGRTQSEADAARNRLAATMLFTALGIPMLTEGQEFLHSKRGINNTFDRGDAVNALDWARREDPVRRATMEYYRGLIALRQSAAGAAFRRRERAPAEYYRWIEPDEPAALGYIVNAAGREPGGTFCVLVNAADRAVRFSCPLPAGRWKLLGDGRRIDSEGIKTFPFSAADGRAAAIKVPPGTTYILSRDSRNNTRHQ